MTYSLISERKTDVKISGPEDISAFLRKKYGKMKQEAFFVIPLDAAHNVIDVKMVTIGILNRTLIHPREVFHHAIDKNAAAVIVSHNHPSGNLDPSADDLSLTRRLLASGELIGIPVLDHILFSSDDSFYSFMEKGRMRELGGAV